MARKSKAEKDRVAAGVSRPSYLSVPTPAEQRAIRDATVDQHLRRARALAISPNGPAAREGYARASALGAPDLVAASAASGKARAWEKENERVKEYYARQGLTLDPKKEDDRLKCRPKSSKGDGNGRAFIPWSDKC